MPFAKAASRAADCRRITHRVADPCFPGVSERSGGRPASSFPQSLEPEQGQVLVTGRVLLCLVVWEEQAKA